MSKKIWGLAGAVAAGAALAVPSGATAQQVGTPTGCASTNTLDLSPAATITIKTCEAAGVPQCDGENVYIPLDPLVRARISTCVL